MAQPRFRLAGLTRERTCDDDEALPPLAVGFGFQDVDAWLHAADTGTMGAR